jgi:putative transposase
MNSSWPQRTGDSFQRNKVSRQSKAEAAQLYMEGLSLSAIGRRFHVSKEAVRQWMVKFEGFFASKRRRLSTVKKRPAILLDETGIKWNGRAAYVSVCLDLARREVVAAKSYPAISVPSTIDTVRQALKVCSRTRRPVFIVDHASWYPDAFRWLDLEWVTLTNSVRNYIERWYRTFKDRTKRFYNNFGIRDGSRAIKRIERFTHMFAYWYNHIRPHERWKGSTPSSLS